MDATETERVAGKRLLHSSRGQPRSDTGPRRLSPRRFGSDDQVLEVVVSDHPLERLGVPAKIVLQSLEWPVPEGLLPPTALRACINCDGDYDGAIEDSLSVVDVIRFHRERGIHNQHRVATMESEEVNRSRAKSRRVGEVTNGRHLLTNPAERPKITLSGR